MKNDHRPGSNLIAQEAIMAGIIAKQTRRCECGAPTRLLRLVKTAPTCTGDVCLACGWESKPRFTLDANGQAVAVEDVARVGGMVAA